MATDEKVSASICKNADFILMLSWSAFSKISPVIIFTTSPNAAIIIVPEASISCGFKNLTIASYMIQITDNAMVSPLINAANTSALKYPNDFWSLISFVEIIRAKRDNPKAKA